MADHGLKVTVTRARTEPPFLSVRWAWLVNTTGKPTLLGPGARRLALRIDAPVTVILPAAGTTTRS